MSGMQGVNLELVIKSWAHDNGWSLERGFKFLSSRDCLRTGAELLGYDISFAAELGRVLEAKGYDVPPLTVRNEETGSAQSYSGRSHEGFRKTYGRLNVTLDEYLDMRTEFSRKDIAYMYNLSGNTIQQKLRRWGIKNMAEEEALVERRKRELA